MSSPTIFNFDNKAVRTVTGKDGEPLFVGKDVCQILGYSNHNDAMNDHCRGVAIRYPILDSLGRTQEARVLTEADVLRLIVRSSLPEAVRFEKWVFEEVLPTIRKTGSYSIPTPTAPASPVVVEMQFWEAATKLLNIAPSGVLGGVRKIAATYGMATLDQLPNYAIDAPTSSTTGSSEPTASASTLLKKHDIKMSTVKFNTKLVEIGLLADMTRPSTSSPTGFKTFKAVVGKGLDYGKNVTNPGNPRETQPHWYSHKFPDLIDLLK
jgi:prophage antirepressor-like protein